MAQNISLTGRWKTLNGEWYSFDYLAVIFKKVEGKDFFFKIDFDQLDQYKVWIG